MSRNYRINDMTPENELSGVGWGRTEQEDCQFRG